MIDDILGLIVLEIVSGAVTAAASGGRGVSAGTVLGDSVASRALPRGDDRIGSVPIGAPSSALAAWTGQRGFLLVVGLALCFTLAYAAELGLADIIGAFAAGVMLDPYGEGVRTPEEEATLSDLMHPLGMFFVPLFFVMMGLRVELGNIANRETLILGAGLVVVALVGKLLAPLGVVGGGTNRLAVGMGMVPRGEVGLIFAGVGSGLMLDGAPVISPGVFSALVVMGLVTTLLAPVGLRWAFRRSEPRAHATRSPGEHSRPGGRAVIVPE